MGVKGRLWDVFNCVKTDVTIPQLSGSIIAIDAPMWLVPFEQKSDSPSFSLEYAFICKIIPLIENGVRPIVVFEGKTLIAAKLSTKMERLKRNVVVNYDHSGALKRAVTAVSKRNNSQIANKDIDEESKRQRFDSHIEKDEDDDDDVMLIEVEPDECKGYNPLHFPQKNQNEFLKLLAITQERIVNPVTERTTEDFCMSQLKNAVHHGRAAKSIEKIRRGELRKSSKSPDVEIIDEETEDKTFVPIHTQLTLDVFTEKEARKIKNVSECASSSSTSETRNRLANSKDRKNMVKALVESLIGDSLQESDVQREPTPIKELTPELPERVSRSTNHTAVVAEVEFMESESSSDSEDDGVKDWIPNHPEADIELIRDPGDEKFRNDNKYDLLKMMLASLGLPYVEAPGEAEAQCVYLKRIGLVDSIASEDSDNIPLGAPTVIRHLCSRTESPHYYALDMMPEDYKMSNAFWAIVATLVGCDYAVGVKGCGVVGAVELLLELYPPFDLETNTDKETVHDFVENLIEKIKIWIRNPKTDESKNVSRLRNKFKGIDVNSLRVPYEFISPVVNESKIPFVFSKGNYARLEHLMIDSGVPVKSAKMLRLSVNKWNRHVESQNQYFKKITTCFTQFNEQIRKNQEGYSEYLGTRLTNAFMRYSIKKISEEVNEESEKTAGSSKD